MEIEFTSPQDELRGDTTAPKGEVWHAPSLNRDIRHGNQENLFPRFETYRENIDGKYWFPAYTRADDVLRFRDHAVRIGMTVRYSEYKQFKSFIKIGPAEPVKPDETKPPLQE